jgi:hypothetical protein
MFARSGKLLLVLASTVILGSKSRGTLGHSPEHFIGRHSYLPVNWRSFIRLTPDQWVSHCYAIERDRSFYCALFCVLWLVRVNVQSVCALNTRYIHTEQLAKLYISSGIHLQRIATPDQARPGSLVSQSVSMWQKNMTVSPEGPATKKDCAGEAHQWFIWREYTVYLDSDYWDSVGVISHKHSV